MNFALRRSSLGLLCVLAMHGPSKRAHLLLNGLTVGITPLGSSDQCDAFAAIGAVGLEAVEMGHALSMRPVNREDAHTTDCNRLLSEINSQTRSTVTMTVGGGT